MENEPLGLPKRSIRALLTIMLVGLLAVCVFTGNEKGVEAFKYITIGATTFYFGSRVDFNKKEDK